MTPNRLIDANVFLRHILADHAAHSPAARAIFRELASGSITAWTTSTIVAEVVWVLGGGVQKYSREEIGEAVQPLLELQSLHIEGKQTLRRAFEIFRTYNVDFIDALTASEVEQTEPPEMYSFDRDFDRIPGITRIEPPAVP